ncbi:MAG TPA: M48 family metallopeptidase [Candidatus Hydrogenedentes bacterium]|jgi:predicted Zn-dependent protease|nr:M48 family metallopeptidase [Candidatus Hydrogenedentota bacterium]HPK00115.1 M48 family metallopeptidase [Candidatus Hydrogenedentota bacterium]
MRKVFSVLMLSILAMAGCMTLEGEPVKFNILSTQQEIQLGKQLSAEVEKQEKVSKDAALQAYVSQIGARLGSVATRQDVQYSFTVIDNPDTVNAFALPGGHMYLYTGLLKICENEAELAGVMAHEIAHVAAHHHGEAMTKQFGFELLTQLVLGEQPSALAKIATGVFGQGMMSYYSRDNEREADALGMEFLYRAGYRPDGMVSFMQKLIAEEQRSGGGHPLPIFASHPPTQERLARLQNQLQRYPQAELQQISLNQDRYRENVLKRLK